MIVDGNGERYGRQQGLDREFVWVVVGHATAALGGLVGVRLLTYALPPAAYGELALGLTGATLAQQMLFSPLSAAALRYFAPAQEADDLGAYFRSMWTLARGAISLILTVGAVVLGTLLAVGGRAWLGLTAGAVCLAVLVGACSVLDGMQNAARQRVVVAWHNGIAPWVRFVAALALVAAVGAEGSVAMAGFAGGMALLLASQWWFYHHSLATLSEPHNLGRPEDLTHWRRTLVAYARPFVTWGLFHWAHMASDRWVLQAFGSSEAVGLYAVLFQIGYYPMTLLNMLMGQLMAPVLFAHAGDGRDHARLGEARRLNRWLIALMAGLTAAGVAGAALLHRPLFALLVAPQYRGISPLLPVVVAGAGLFACGQVAALTTLSATLSRWLVAPKIVTAALGIALNGVGAVLWGVRGVVAAGAVSAAVYMLWVLVLAESADTCRAGLPDRFALRLFE